MYINEVSVYILAFLWHNRYSTHSAMTSIILKNRESHKLAALKNTHTCSYMYKYMYMYMYFATNNIINKTTHKISLQVLLIQ